MEVTVSSYSMTGWGKGTYKMEYMYVHVPRCLD